MYNMFQHKKFKIMPYDSDSNGINFSDEFNYENIVKFLNKINIDKKYLNKMIDNLKYVKFIKDEKYLSINYIRWIDSDGKEILKLYNRYKGFTYCYYEFEL